MIVRCNKCGGAYSGIRSHSHIQSDLVDSRFASCVTCRGKGAITCDLCQGTGRLELSGDGTTKPAVEFARSQRTLLRNNQKKGPSK